MVRFARVVAPGIAHHITQRGNTRRFILEGDAEKSIYLDLLHQGIERYGMALIGDRLMSNHVHLIAVPKKKDALARSLKDVHGRFVPTGMPPIAPADMCGEDAFTPAHWTRSIWEALRYVELNPVRASMVGRAPDWAWSSAAVHCGAAVSRLAGYGSLGSAMEH